MGVLENIPRDGKISPKELAPSTGIEEDLLSRFLDFQLATQAWAKKSDSHTRSLRMMKILIAAGMQIRWKKRSYP